MIKHIYNTKLDVITLMIISSDNTVKSGHISIPLKKPFKTALRTVNCLEDVVITIETDTGDVGFGEAKEMTRLHQY
jgi:L-alanine-DL-glutamate epimerase-like enolase superfamily enzyme